ncbi:MAG: universal stress protein [Gammaproteobacteria bacterium]
MRQRMQQAVAEIQDALQLTRQSIPVDVVGGHALAAMIIRSVIGHRHDLLIKQAEPRPDGGGLEALDMELLRQCPAPVWLSRPIARSRQQMQVAVAIDPDAETPAERALSLDLLRLGCLANSCNGRLQVIACWDYPFESFLRGSPWSKVSDGELVGIVRDVEQRNRLALDTLVQEAGGSGDIAIAHLKGNAASLIPAQVTALRVDILVMGTLARAGVAGYMIGNTAENVVQAVDCSLLTLKPAGFITPIK